MTREEKKKYDKERYQAIRANPELLMKKRLQARKATLAYYYRNQETQKAKVLKWCKENRQKKLANRAKYRERHPGALRQWHAKNPGKNSHYVHQRRMRKIGNGGTHSFEEWMALMEKNGHKCAYCGAAKKLTRDHKIPLSRGGRDDIENIAPACKSCNSSKGARTVEEWRP